MRRFLPLLSLLLLAVLTGCKPGGPQLTMLEARYKIVLLAAHATRPFEDGQVAALTRLVSQDPAWEQEMQDAAGNAHKQEAQFQSVLQARPLPFAIVVDPLDVAKLKPHVASALQAGVLVIGLGESGTALAGTTALAADQRHLGWLAGDVALRALFTRARENGQTEASGRVVEIRGDDDAPACQRRHEGFVAALKAAPGVILVHDAPGGWTQTGGRDRTADAIRLQQTFDLVYAHNDSMALGAASALQDRRNEVMVIGTDAFRGPEGGLTLIGDGEIDATIYQPLLVDFAWQLLRKKAAEPAFQPKPAYELKSRPFLPKDLDTLRVEGLPPFPDL